jgi:hypothetical protein
MTSSAWPLIGALLAAFTSTVHGAAQAPPPVGQTGAIAGVALDEMRRPVERAVVALTAVDGSIRRTVTTREDGRFEFDGLTRGGFDLTASASGYVPAAFGQRRPGQPGAAIKLAAGDRRTFDLTLVRTGVISGTVMTERGERLSRVIVSALRWFEQGGRRELRVAGATPTDDRGVYRLFNLTPGAYLVGVTTSGIYAPLGTILSDGTERQVAFAPALYAGVRTLQEATLIRVAAGEDRSGIDLTVQLAEVPAQPPLLQSLPQVSGRVLFEAGAVPPPDVRNIGVHLRLEPRFAPGPAVGIVRPDAELRFVSTARPGMHSLDVVAPAPWTVKSAVAGGVDVADVPFQVPLVPPGELVITMTAQVTELSGQVLSKDGSPTFECAVVVFSVDERYVWPGSRRVRLLQPDTDGRFVLANLPPGEYFVAAADVGPDDVAEPATLTALRQGAVRISIAAGEKKSVTVRTRPSGTEKKD